MNKIYSIGLLDYDLLKTKRYFAPNYDIGVIYNYLKEDKNISIRLISSSSYNNLSQYDKIYIFKVSKDLPHPVSFIKDYYKLPFEEYGEGFINRPIRPYQAETRFIKPDFSCYNNMLLFSMSHPNNKISWKIDKRAKGKKYQYVRLYEKIDEEELKKDYPKEDKLIIYDNPLDMFNNEDKFNYLTELLETKKNIFFTQELDISLIKDTNIIEQVLNEKKYAGIRNKLKASNIDGEFGNFLSNILLTGKSKNVKIKVDIPKDISLSNYIIFILLLNEYNYASGYRLKLFPYDTEKRFPNNDLAVSAYRFLNTKNHLMSFYEYIFNISFLRIGVPKEIIHTGEDRYEYILSQYGMNRDLRFVEHFIERHKEYEYLFFLGGDSNYVRQRRKYYNERAGNEAFTRSVDDSSTECCP